MTPTPRSKLARFGLIETEVGVEEGTLQALGRSTDHWAMVLKLHAVIEAALGRVIVEELERPELAAVVDRMQMGHRKGTGRFAMAAALGLLERDDCRRIEGLSMLRNRYAHDPANAALSIPALLETLPQPNRDEIESRLPPRADASPMELEHEWRGRVWIGAMDVLSAVLVARVLQIEKARRPAFDEAMAEAIRKQWDAVIADMNANRVVGTMRDLAEFDYMSGTWKTPSKEKDQP